MSSLEVHNTLNAFYINQDAEGRFLAQLTPSSVKQRISTNDHTGLSFWLLSAVQLSASVFFFFQVWLVPRQWANAMIVNGLVCGIAWQHYDEMREVWVEQKTAPTVYRYMDWLVTVPMQVAEFFLILVAATPPSKGHVSAQIFLRLLIASLLMLVFGYLGETGEIDRWLAFPLGMFMWVYIVYEIYFGEAARKSNSLSVDDARRFLDKLRNATTNSEDDIAVQQVKNIASVDGTASAESKAAAAIDAGSFTKPAAQQAFEMLRAIFSLGWALYPAGYVVGTVYRDSGDYQFAEDTLNAVYNFADLINKVSFGFAIYYAANSKGERQKALMYDYGFADANALKLKNVLEGKEKPEQDFKTIQEQRKNERNRLGAGLSLLGNGKLGGAATPPQKKPEPSPFMIAAAAAAFKEVGARGASRGQTPRSQNANNSPRMMDDFSLDTNGQVTAMGMNNNTGGMDMNNFMGGNVNNQGMGQQYNQGMGQQSPMGNPPMNFLANSNAAFSAPQFQFGDIGMAAMNQNGMGSPNQKAGNPVILGGSPTNPNNAVGAFLGTGANTNINIGLGGKGSPRMNFGI